MSRINHVALVSLEPWDDVWRRNQHLAARLVRQGHVRHLTFVNSVSRRPRAPYGPEQGISVLTPRLRVPKRLGGLGEVARSLRRITEDADVLWVNDPTIGRYLLTRGKPALYDVTDDWREAAAGPRTRRRIVHAEDLLARRARTLVCSRVLAQTWLSRYGVRATLVPNGVDLESMRTAEPLPLAGAAPHAGYVGTLHPERLDVSLVERLAALPQLGTLHLVGPDSLDGHSRARLMAQARVRLEGAVGVDQVPRWLRSLDVLVCPHRVTPFTLSLDAIKAHEYLASGRPIVATPTSGFQDLTAPGLQVTTDVTDALCSALADPGGYGPRGAVDWNERAFVFAEALQTCLAP